MTQKEHREIWFSGEVQGVGFRAMAVRLANHHNIHGRVKNLEDGRVWLAVEGTPQLVDHYLTALQRMMSFCIRSVDIQKGDVLKNWEDFKIEY